MNFRRRGKRPAFDTIAFHNLYNLIGKLFMNAAVGFDRGTDPAGDRNRPPAPSLTGKRPAKSVTLSTSFPCASVILNACTSLRLGPRVGVSSTRYAFKLPRSVTMMRELGVIANQRPRLAAHENARITLYN